MQKDYWNSARRNFRAMAIAGSILVILYGLAFFMNTHLPYTIRAPYLKVAGIYAVIVILFLVIASLFKRRSLKAITLGYAYLGIGFLLNLVYYFVLNSPADFLKQGAVLKIAGFLVFIYLVNNIYKASKQGVVPKPY